LTIVIDDPLPRRARPGEADVIIIARPDRPNSIVGPQARICEQQSTKKSDVGQQPPSRLEPVGLLGAAAADAARSASAPASRARQ
jgi:hypothetical protein